MCLTSLSVVVQETRAALASEEEYILLLRPRHQASLTQQNPLPWTTLLHHLQCLSPLSSSRKTSLLKYSFVLEVRAILFILGNLFRIGDIPEIIVISGAIIESIHGFNSLPAIVFEKLLKSV